MVLRYIKIKNVDIQKCTEITNSICPCENRISIYLRFMCIIAR